VSVKSGEVHKTVDTWLGKLKAEDKNQETLRSYVKDIKVFAKYLAGRGLVGPLALELGDEKAIVALKISAICIAS